MNKTPHDAILVDGLVKSYRRRLPQEQGLSWQQRLQQRWRPAYELVPAVTALSFAVRAGEKLAFIGPNGAGKSTTLKMLTGILYPTAGHATVAGLVPWQQRQALAHHIGIVFGQRSQLWANLPVRDGLQLLGRLYGLPSATLRARIAELAAVFALQDLLDQQAGKLSLGQRMRAELAASLLHRPKILLLDEPTIGLDISSKTQLRAHLNQLAAAEGVTILLTSHDVGDIEEVADRVMVINHGQLVFDNSLLALTQQFLTHKLVRLHFAAPMRGDDLQRLLPHGVALSVLDQRSAELNIDLAAVSLPELLGRLLPQLPVQDMTIDNPPLEQMIQRIYQGG
jgi:ABC-2 type transport system ATP-binding protein